MQPFWLIGVLVKSGDGELGAGFVTTIVGVSREGVVVSILVEGAQAPRAPEDNSNNKISVSSKYLSFFSHFPISFPDIQFKHRHHRQMVRASTVNNFIHAYGIDRPAIPDIINMLD